MTPHERLLRDFGFSPIGKLVNGETKKKDGREYVSIDVAWQCSSVDRTGPICYVFLIDGEVKYVGISGTKKQTFDDRLKDHCSGWRHELSDKPSTQTAYKPEYEKTYLPIVKAGAADIWALQEADAPRLTFRPNEIENPCVEGIEKLLIGVFTETASNGLDRRK